jgi:hypothetical protein
MTFCPGKKVKFKHSISWNRNLITDLKELKEVFQINTLISLLTVEEYIKLGVVNLIDEA